MESASRNMNVMECLFWLLSILLYWFRYYRSVALRLCACFLMQIEYWLIHKASMTYILQQWQIGLSWCMWRPTRVPIMVTPNVIISYVTVLLDFTPKADWDASAEVLQREVIFSEEGGITRFWRHLLTCLASDYLQFLTLCHSAPHLAASPPSFSKSPLKALLKARTGSDVTLECKPEAWPPAISLWKKGNEILQRAER